MGLSEHASIDLLDLADIGGTNAQNNGGWLSMKSFARVMAYVEIGTWNSGDDLDECRLQQATDSSGTSAKDLTTDASGGNYDTDNPVDADGDFVVLEARSEDLDTTNGFDHVRLYVAEGGNSGVDNVAGVLIRYGSAYPKKEVQGAASTGSKVYVNP
tara:strand:+ start:28 stop:498 length:471 start_codon:yes stop_codon:yes gene_type:complete